MCSARTGRRRKRRESVRCTSLHVRAAALPTDWQHLALWLEEGREGLDDKPRTRLALKTTLGDMHALCEIQCNPELGTFRVHAALKRLGIVLSPRTCGHIFIFDAERPGHDAGAHLAGACDRLQAAGPVVARPKQVLVKMSQNGTARSREPFVREGLVYQCGKPSLKYYAKAGSMV